MSSEDLQQGRLVLSNAAEAIKRVSESLGESFSDAVRHLYECKGRVIVTGVGKSGLVGRKIAATFASTGTPSLFMHSTEALHGDLGMIQPSDLLFVLCNSGETEEVVSLVRFLRQRDKSDDNDDLIIVSIVGRKESTIARESDVTILIPPIKEGCLIGLAPMASTTAMIALGDGIARALMKRSDFNESKFQRYHPGGNLGRKLSITVRDLMIPLEQVSLVAPDDSVRIMIESMSECNVGATLVALDDKLQGIFTDGDVKRFLLSNDGKSLETILAMKVKDVMTSKPKDVDAEYSADEAFVFMEEMNITVMPVVSQGNVLGLIRLHDIVQAKIR